MSSTPSLLDRCDRMVVTTANGPRDAQTSEGHDTGGQAPMPDNRNTEPRKYAMTRLSAGDYLLPSNDAQTLWRLCTYEEDGSAENWQGRKVVGTFWALYKWDGGFPSPDSLADALEMHEWTRWQFWAGPLGSRKEAVEEALRVRA